MRQLQTALLTLSLAALAAAVSHADPYDKLMSRVPESANMLVLIDNEGLMKSPLGVKKNWADNYKSTAIGGLFGNSPDILRTVLASQVDHHTLEQEWQIAVADLKYSITINSVVSASKGAFDSVGGFQVALTPQNSYLTLFNSMQIGMMSPANRQGLSRWMRTTGRTGDSRVSQYLQASVDNLPKDVQAQIAIDLGDMFEADGLRTRFKKSQILSDGGIDVEAATKLFSSVKGITLMLRVDHDIQGEVRMHFNEPPTLIQLVAKKMLMHALGSMGATIDDFNDWDTSIDGKAVVLRGKLTERSARRIFSPLGRPITIGTKDADPAQDTPVAASQRYYAAVNSLIEDLKETKSRDLNQRSFWHKQFADKIDALPILNVDDDLLKFGASISNTFRALGNYATYIRRQEKAVANATYQGVTVTPGSYYYGNGTAGWGYGSVTSNYATAQNYMSVAGNTESAVRNATWRKIEEATEEIRRVMTQKYHVEFK